MFRAKYKFGSTLVYESVDLTIESITQQVRSHIENKTKQRRFNIREVLIKQKNLNLTHCAIDVLEKIFQISEQRFHRAIEIGQGWLAKQTGYCRQTVNRILKELERKGVLVIHKRELGFTHQYQVRFSDDLIKQTKSIPDFNKKKYFEGRGVSHSVTQSNLDHININNNSYNIYSEAKKNFCFSTNKTRSTDNLDTYNPSHEIFKEKEVVVARKEVAMSFMKQIKMKLGLTA